MDKLIGVLYKKVHRQYLRQFKVGRKFKCDGEVHEIIKEPYIGRYKNYICIDRIIDNEPKPIPLCLFDVSESEVFGYGCLWYVQWIS